METENEFKILSGILEIKNYQISILNETIDCFNKNKTLLKERKNNTEKQLIAMRKYESLKKDINEYKAKLDSLKLKEFSNNSEMLPSVKNLSFSEEILKLKHELLESMKKYLGQSCNKIEEYLKAQSHSEVSVDKIMKKIIKIHKLEQLQGKIANLEKEVATLIRKKEYFYNNSDDSIEELEHSLEMMDTHT